MIATLPLLALALAAEPATPLPPPDSIPVDEPAPPPPAKPPVGPEEEPAVEVPAPPAGWFPGEGFRIRSPDGAYGLRLGMMAGYKFEPVFLDGEAEPRASFLLLRGYVSGNLYREWIRFYTAVELAANPVHALDAFVELRPWEAFGVRFGQQYVPFSRHESFGPASLLFPDWSVVANYFWAGWDTGATVLGALGGGRFEYYAGLYSASPLRQYRSVPGNYQAMGRITVSPLGPLGPTEMPYVFAAEVPFRWSFTAQAYGGEARLSRENFNPVSGLFEFDVIDQESRRVTGGVDLAFQADRLSFLAEAYARRTDPADGSPSFTSLGTWAQAGLAVRRDATVGLRWSWLDPSGDLDDDHLTALEAAGTWYVDPGQLHLQLRAGMVVQEEPTAPPESVPLPANPGTAQVITVQGGVFY